MTMTQAIEEIKALAGERTWAVQFEASSYCEQKRKAYVQGVGQFGWYDAPTWAALVDIVAVAIRQTRAALNAAPPDGEFPAAEVTP